VRDRRSSAVRGSVQSAQDRKGRRYWRIRLRLRRPWRDGALYIPRGGVAATATAAAIPGRVTVFDLDTLAPVGEIPNTRGNGVAVDNKSGQRICQQQAGGDVRHEDAGADQDDRVQGNPDGILADAFNGRVYVLSHAVPHVTVIDAKDGAVLGTIDLGGAPEQAALTAWPHLRRRLRQGERRRSSMPRR